MHNTVKNLIDIKNNINIHLNKLNIDNHPKIVAVSKTFKIDKILPLIDHGHLDYGENKVQEAVEKWEKVKKENNNIKLHLIGKLQTNKVKFAVKIFDYIHSLDSEKLANKIASYENHKIKLFIQVNIGNEEQKSGISVNKVDDFYKFCKDLKLNVVGLMCIPPIDDNSAIHFKKMLDLKQKLNFNELSMGMSSDYLDALQHGSTFLRIGSDIFGKRN